MSTTVTAATADDSQGFGNGNGNGNGNSTNKDVSSGAYVLRDLIRNVPLSADGESDNVHITCVEAWEGNLYIGTSAAEILHFVSIGPDADSSDGQASYILASRTQPVSTSPSTAGVEQILLLPSVAKACILCNGTLTFYTLPELSPAFGGKIKQSDCTWVGGLDRNVEIQDVDPREGAVIIICLKQRLRLIRIGETARKVRDIELKGCMDVQRRGDLACVADDKSYALLDVVNQAKIDLLPISSVADTAVSENNSRSASPIPDPPPIERPLTRSHSARVPDRKAALRGHERISSLGSAPRSSDRLRPDSDSPGPWPDRSASRARASPNRSPSRPGMSSRTSSRPGASPSPSRSASPAVDTDNKPVPPPPSTKSSTSPPIPRLPDSALRPHVASPTPHEFLLTTGTTKEDPGVGMFMNLDGDVSRGTIEFSSYPDALVLDGKGSDPSNPPTPGNLPDEGYVLALLQRPTDGKLETVIEYQRWDVEMGEDEHTKGCISLSSVAADTAVGLREAITSTTLTVPSISNALSLRRLSLKDAGNGSSEADAKRERDEDQLIAQFANVQARVLLYSGDCVYWLVRNPLIGQLESQLQAAKVIDTEHNTFTVSRHSVQRVINTLRGREARDEFEFLGFNYIRQHASLLLLIDLILKTQSGVTASESDKRATHDALATGEIDPRTLLAIVPVLSEEVVEGEKGMWIPNGLAQTIAAFRRTQQSTRPSTDKSGPSPFSENLLQVIKQYLFVWRRKKGFGSIADEEQVFATVDAALVHVLLLLDQDSPTGPATPGSVRAELNDVVDRGVEPFDRAVALLEQYHRLYILSRLYQSRKRIEKVLETWRRILEGEADAGGEMVDGENDVRKYITRIKDPALVREYGAWLANRNPKLGVQVFADENARVKWDVNVVVALLKEKAPGAVKEYLEFLVFGKNYVNYVNDLLNFYLDTVISALTDPASPAPSILTQTYITYRALLPPKPTYRQFLLDNPHPAPWYANRLRLLQLIGGSHTAASRYDTPALAARLDPFADLLVPEMIILNGRRGHHIEALRLLVHGLADFDTAIRYCLLGGSCIFGVAQPARDLDNSVPMPEDPPLPTETEQRSLFAHLLTEFLALTDPPQRLARTAELLDRFGAFFDAEHVLPLLPVEWPLRRFEPFFVAALRRCVSERCESVVVRALASASNIRFSAQLVERIGQEGPRVEEKEFERVGVSGDSGVA